MSESELGSLEDEFLDLDFRGPDAEGLGAGELWLADEGREALLRLVFLLLFLLLLLLLSSSPKSGPE